MPQNWMEDDAHRQRFQNSKWTSGKPSRRIVSGRVLRAGIRATDSNASYWDIILLTSGEGEIDLKASGVYASNPLPVRPYIADVAAGPDNSYQAGDIISISLDGSCSRQDGSIEPGTEIEDYVQVFPGFHYVVASGGGGSSCAVGINTFGVLFG